LLDVSRQQYVVGVEATDVLTRRGLDAAIARRGQAGMFGRLLEYKGLDLLAEALASVGSPTDFALMVVGTGPDSRALRALAALPGVTLESLGAGG
jgi:glycosyltransferase involved in cell wall biosynthesis